MSRFDYFEFDGSSIFTLQDLRLAAMQFEEVLLTRLGESRPRSLALTKLEEAYMWAGKAVRDGQREGDTNA